MTKKVESEKVRLLINALRIVETGKPRMIEFTDHSEQAMKEITQEYGRIFSNNFPIFEQMDGTFQMRAFGK